MIKLSDKHGVNPCIPICWWCGNEKHEVALLGKLKGDAEAPRHAILDYEPCDKCKADMALGCTVIEVTDAPLERPQIQEGLWPTGRWCVITKDAAKRLFECEHNRMLVDKNIFEELINFDKDTGRS